MSDPILRQLPAVHEVLNQPVLAALRAAWGYEAVLHSVRAVLAESRGRLARGEPTSVDPTSLGKRVVALLEAERPYLRKVINASGILLHTGLGRAPLAEEVVQAVAEVARGYCNLEFDLDTGERGRRTSGVAELLVRLTGAEAATVVNNNAGATVLALRALASGREVIVSRGQLVEIGGSFRLPEIFEVSGAKLREVGTTNRTRLSDYERAIGPETAALLRVHPSNYRIVGFTEEVSIADLAMLARQRGLQTIDDVGSGALGPDRPPQVAGEPTIAEGLAAGADLVLGSGDKLLGGPQCGLLLGSRSAIARVESDPLMRALRVDKMTLAALEATLRLALDPTLASRRIPLWAFLTTAPARLQARAEQLARRLRDELGLNATAEATQAFFGGGSQPAEPLSSFGVRISPPYPAPFAGESSWASALRTGSPAIVPRVQGGSVLLDLRAVADSDDEVIVEALRHAAGRAEGDGARPTAI